MLYKRKHEDLNKLRYSIYMQLVTTTKSLIKPERLPPTMTAEKYHSYCGYLQINQWLTFNNSLKDPTERGWKLENFMYQPVATTKEAAPQELIKIIRCGCKINQNACSTNICSCRKNGLPCVPSCTNCHGLDCSNIKDTIYASSVDGNFERNIFDLFD